MTESLCRKPLTGRDVHGKGRSLHERPGSLTGMGFTDGPETLVNKYQEAKRSHKAQCAPQNTKAQKRAKAQQERKGV